MSNSSYVLFLSQLWIMKDVTIEGSPWLLWRCHSSTSQDVKVFKHEWLTPRPPPLLKKANPYLLAICKSFCNTCSTQVCPVTLTLHQNILQSGIKCFHLFPLQTVITFYKTNTVSKGNQHIIFLIISHLTKRKFITWSKYKILPLNRLPVWVCNWDDCIWPVSLFSGFHWILNTEYTLNTRKL